MTNPDKPPTKPSLEVSYRRGSWSDGLLFLSIGITIGILILVIITIGAR